MYSKSCLVLLFCVLGLAHASHFRYSFISWTVDASASNCCGAAANSKCVSFILTHAWARNSGQSFFLTFGDGGSGSYLGTMIEQNTDAGGAAYDVFEARFSKCYNIASTQVFNVYGSTCCRVGGILNAASDFAAQTRVDLRDTTNLNSPRVSVPTVVNLPVTGPGPYRISAVDPDGSPVTCTLVGNGGVYPVWYTSGARSISLAPGTCDLLFAGTSNNDRYAINVLVQDAQGGSTNLDFMVVISSVIIKSNPPVCSSLSSNVASNGNTVQYRFSISDPDNDSITISHQGPYPTGTSSNPNTGSVVTNTVSPQSLIVTYTPPPGWTGPSTSGTIFLTDAGGLTATCIYSFTYSSNPIVLSVSPSSNALCGYTLPCFGSTTTLTVTANGGTAPYSFIWNNGVSGSTNPNVGAGTYNVVGSDANQGSGSQTYYVTQPNPFTLTCSTPVAACAGTCQSSSTITCTISGGCAPFTISIPGETQTVNSYSVTFNNAPAGTYAVSGTDANMCSATSPQTFNIVGVNGINIQTNVRRRGTTEDVLCRGEYTTISITVSGGCQNQGYQIYWNNNAFPTRSGVPANTQQDYTALAGTYTVNVRDQNGLGCIASRVITVTEPSATFTTSYTIPSQNACGHVTCYDDSNAAISVTHSPANPSTTITWNLPALNGQFNPTGLDDGAYQYSIVDYNGCTIQSPVINIVDGSTALAISTNSNPLNFACPSVQCNSDTGRIDVQVSGGCGTKTIVWDSANPTQVASGTTSASGLAAGTYALTITDSAGCSRRVTSTISKPTTLTASFTKTDVKCFNGNDGTISVVPSGGCSNYAIVWSGGPVTASGFNPTGLTAGTYNYVVYDRNQCTVSGSVTIGQPTLLTSPITVLCGEISTAPVGGVAPYSITWNKDGAFYSNVAALTNPPFGVYSLTVVDANSCTVTGSTTLRSPTVSSDQVDLTSWTPQSGSWTTTASSAIQSQTGSGLFLLTSNINYSVQSAILGNFTTPSSSAAQSVFGLIAGWAPGNQYYYMVEWRNTNTGTACNASPMSGLRLLRVPTGATECEIAHRANGVTVLQTASARATAPWSNSIQHTFVFSMTSGYVAFYLGADLELDYWFGSTDPVVQDGRYALFASSQAGIKFEFIGTDAVMSNCPTSGAVSLVKRFTSDTSCSGISFSINWGDGQSSFINSRSYSLDSNNMGTTDLFTHEYTSSNRYRGQICMYVDGYTHCDPFEVVIAEMFIAKNVIDNMTWTMYSPTNITWFQPNSGASVVRTIKAEIKNFSASTKLATIGSEYSSEPIIKYRGVSGITPSNYKLALYWEQGNKICHFKGSPFNLKVRISGQPNLIDQTAIN